MPQKMAKAMPRNSRLLSRKLDSRDSSESSWLSERSRGRRQKSSASEPTMTSARNVRKYGPIADSANACTEARMPLRTTNVPKMLRKNATMISATFQALSMPRRSCIWMLWMNAVPTSQGMSATFSTGSQPQ